MDDCHQECHREGAVSVLDSQADQVLSSKGGDDIAAATLVATPSRAPAT
jgi:hypothetical protein